jgi:hypothetical protein
MVRGHDRSEATQTLFYFQILFKFIFNSISNLFSIATQTLISNTFQFCFNSKVSKVSQIYISHEDLVCIGRFCELTLNRPMPMRPKLYFISKYFSILFQFNLNLFQKFLKIYFPMILEILDKTPTS